MQYRCQRAYVAVAQTQPVPRGKRATGITARIAVVPRGGEKPKERVTSPESRGGLHGAGAGGRAGQGSATPSRLRPWSAWQPRQWQAQGFRIFGRKVVEFRACGATRFASGRGERMRASGPLERGVRRPSIPRRSWQQLERLRKTRTNADGREATTVGRQYSVDAAPLGYSGDGPIDQSQIELSEVRVDLKGPNDVGRKRPLIFVAGSRIKNLGDQLAHGGPVVSQKVVHLRQNEARHDHQSRGRQLFSYSGKLGLPPLVLASARRSPPVSATIAGLKSRDLGRDPTRLQA